MLEAFEVVKYLFGRFGKKIYSSDLAQVTSSLPPAVATILSVLSKFDICDAKNLQVYISFLKKQNMKDIDMLEVVEEHSSVVYTK